MIYSLKIDCDLLRKLKKLKRKNSRQVDMILRKTEDILKNPGRYKNLRAPLNDWKRVHIDKHFVLVFSVDNKQKTVTLEDFDHHDNIYRKK